MFRYCLSFFILFSTSFSYVLAQSEDDKLRLANMPRQAGLSAQDGISDYFPLVRISPFYPRKAKRKKIEGFVIASTTVIEDGSTEGCVIVAVVPKKFKFEKEACRAINKFKYRPKKDANGDNISTEDVRWRFIFTLDGRNSYSGG